MGTETWPKRNPQTALWERFHLDLATSFKIIIRVLFSAEKWDEESKITIALPLSRCGQSVQTNVRPSVSRMEEEQSRGDVFIFARSGADGGRIAFQTEPQKNPRRRKNYTVWSTRLRGRKAGRRRKACYDTARRGARKSYSDDIGSGAINLTLKVIQIRQSYY